MRTFETGATRDTEEGKLDYEGFLSPLALEAYARYMHGHRTQADGSLRDSDNWQKGMPLSVYMKSLWRHLVALWTLHRHGGPSEKFDEALGGIIFNTFGYWHTHLQGAGKKGSLEEALEPFREKSFAGEISEGKTLESYAKEVGKAADAVAKAQAAKFSKRLYRDG